MQLTSDQEHAALTILRGGVLGGYAGTGKSVTIAEAVRRGQEQGDPPILAAPTNKAASVLRRLAPANCLVTTIHSLCTTPAEVPALDDDGNVIPGRTKMMFKAKDVPIKSLVIIDEASMLGESFLRRIEHLLPRRALVGDPFQLPPVQDRQILSEEGCDFLLTHVMRTALDNPALAYATELRSGGGRKASEFGVRVSDGIMSSDLGPMGETDAICITYTNSDRHWFNAKIRQHLHGRVGWKPKAADKVICRFSDGERGLFKGLPGTISRVEDVDSDEAWIHVLWDGMERELEHRVDRRRLAGKDVPYDAQFGDHIEYGYALTCHSAQGSSWGRVYLVPNIRLLLKNQGRQGMRRWMYTGLTRITGSGEVTIVRND